MVLDEFMVSSCCSDQVMFYRTMLECSHEYDAVDDGPINTAVPGGVAFFTSSVEREKACLKPDIMKSCSLTEIDISGEVRRGREMDRQQTAGHGMGLSTSVSGTVDDTWGMRISPGQVPPRAPYCGWPEDCRRLHK